MHDLSFSLLELLNLLALLPSLFAVVMLLVMSRSRMQLYVPILFLATLMCSFVLALSRIYAAHYPWMTTVLLWCESMQPAMCFLLILQLWQDRFPRPVYWLILLLPLVGGTSLVYATSKVEIACFYVDYCLPSTAFRSLYQLFATSQIFLLLMVHLARLPIANAQRGHYQSHRFWLIVALISLFLSLLLFDLLRLSGAISDVQHEIIHGVIRLSFIYLVMTSLLRVFDHISQAASSVQVRPIDPDIVARIEQAMQVDLLYREMGFSREKCAERLGLQEHVLSRTINQAFGKNFNEYINSYRIHEAKQRLAAETTSITAIAFEVGFSSIASFNRVFRAMVGCSPTEYRASSAELVQS